MDELIPLITKMNDAANPLTGWTDAERALIKSIMPTPEAIAKSIATLVKKDDDERRDHTDDCPCRLCLGADWWTKPEDASEALTLVREKSKKEYEESKRTIPRWNEEEQRFIKPGG